MLGRVQDTHLGRPAGLNAPLLLVCGCVFAQGWSLLTVPNAMLVVCVWCLVLTCAAVSPPESSCFAVKLEVYKKQGPAQQLVRQLTGKSVSPLLTIYFTLQKA